MSNIRIAIIELFRAGKRQCEIARSLKVARQTVSDAVKRFNQLGHAGDRTGRGRKRTVRTSVNRKIIKQRVQRNSRVSMRRISRETGISATSVRRIAKVDLRLKAYKLRRAQLLKNENKEIRLQRCRELARRHAAGNWKRILFTDEKIFTVEQHHNHQNDRNWSSEAPGPSSIVAHRQSPQSVMVWAGICASGKTPLVFVDQGIKLCQEVYRRDVLQSVVLPWAQQHFGNEDWTFQQDSAPAHKAKKTQQWCKDNLPNFITAEEWPPYSPDLNPMDYAIWSILETRACSKPHRNLESLKRSLLAEWAKISIDEVRATAENFIKRLQLCIKAKGGYFENI